MTTENQAVNTSKTDIKKREFFLRGRVDDSTMKAIFEGILEINEYDAEQEEKDPSYVRKPIKLYVETYGGNPYEGFSVVGAIEASETPVHTYCYGRAMSMGFLIFAVGHKRFAPRTAWFMYHDAGTSLAGKLQEIDEGLVQLRRVTKMYDEILLDYTNLKKAKLDSVKKAKKNWYLTANEALEHGLVDEILPTKRKK